MAVGSAGGLVSQEPLRLLQMHMVIDGHFMEFPFLA
jgi:hypothetical protein